MSHHLSFPKWVMILVILSSLVMGIALVIRDKATPFFADQGIPFGIVQSVGIACVLLIFIVSLFGGSAALVVGIRKLVRGGM